MISLVLLFIDFIQPDVKLNNFISFLIVNFIGSLPFAFMPIIDQGAQDGNFPASHNWRRLWYRSPDISLPRSLEILYQNHRNPWLSRC